jgi:hypothetical protein
MQAPARPAACGALLIAALLSGPASADEKTPQTLWGYGVRACADYVAACVQDDAGDPAELQRYEDWLTGFISGLNLATGEDMLRGSGIESAMRRTRAFCERKPEQDFFNASMDFVRALNDLD